MNIETRRLDPEIAHELRSPLAALAGVIDLLREGGSGLDPSETEELLDAARLELQHVMDMVERARSGSIGGDLEPVQLAEVAARALERFPAVERRTYLRVDRTVIAAAHTTSIDQIMTNLIQNVDRYARDGDVEIRMGWDGGRVWIEVADQGPGIPAEKAKAVFRAGGQSEGEGLHVGLDLSRALARSADGDLVLKPAEVGATFRLTLPGFASLPTMVGKALVPRARVLVELAEALDTTSIEGVEIGVHRLASDILGASATCLLRRDNDRMVPLTRRHPSQGFPASWIDHQIDGAADFTEFLGVPHGVVLRLPVDSSLPGHVLVGYDEAARHAQIDPAVRDAFATVTGLAVERALLSEELSNERIMRSSVMEALPIAISIFVGDPPRLIDWNQAERNMLGLDPDDKRASEIDRSQEQFNVRFADGSPLTVDNAPVTAAIRAGKAAGPFHLKVTRADGTEVLTRTYCAPFTDVSGRGVGAVVTSDIVGEL